MALLAIPVRADGLVVTPARLWESSPRAEPRSYVFRASGDDLSHWSVTLESFTLDAEGRPSRTPAGPAAAPFRIAATSLDSESGVVTVAFDPPAGSDGSFWAALVLAGPPLRQSWSDGAVIIEPVVIVPLVVTIGEQQPSVEFRGLEAFRTREGIEVRARIQNGGTALRLSPQLVLEKAGDVPIECSVTAMTPVVLLPSDDRSLRVILPDDRCAERILLMLPGLESQGAPIRPSSPAA